MESCAAFWAFTYLEIQSFTRVDYPAGGCSRKL